MSGNGDRLGWRETYVLVSKYLSWARKGGPDLKEGLNKYLMANRGSSQTKKRYLGDSGYDAVFGREGIPIVRRIAYARTR